MPWVSVNYVVEPLESSAIDEFVEAIGDVYHNGGIIVRAFRATNGDEFDRSMSLDTRSDDVVLPIILTSPSVVAALPELRIQLPLEKPPVFSTRCAFSVEGDLTNLLLAGGAYEKFRGTVEQARTLSRQFMEAIFGEELHLVGRVGVSHTPWTPWFFDIMWDYTYVVLDFQKRRVVLICMTDTD